MFNIAGKRGKDNYSIGVLEDHPIYYKDIFKPRCVTYYTRVIGWTKEPGKKPTLTTHDRGIVSIMFVVTENPLARINFLLSNGDIVYVNQ